MKKLLIIGLLFLATISANAQDTIFRGNNPDYLNTTIKKEKFPAAKWAIIMDPLATLGSGIALGADFFVDRIQIRALGGIYTGSNPWFYREENFGYQGYTLENYFGYRFELQLRKDLTEDKADNSRFAAGIFANIRGISIKGSEDYINYNFVPGRPVLNPANLNGSVITFGPIFAFSEHRKLWYLDMHIGPGMIVNAGGKNNDVVGIELVNPYNPGVMLKFGLVIGLNMK